MLVFDAGLLYVVSFWALLFIVNSLLKVGIVFYSLLFFFNCCRSYLNSCFKRYKPTNFTDEYQIKQTGSLEEATNL